MQKLIEKNTNCPYCGELIDILIDSSMDEQEYIEDCSVCCRPIILHLVIESMDKPDEIKIEVKNENE